MEENQHQPENSMDALKGMLEEQFPEIVRVVAYEGLEDFDIEIKENTAVPAFLKAVNEYLGRFILDYGDPEESYNISVQCGNALIDVLHYNDSDSEYHIEIEIDGKPTQLRIVDAMGRTGDYSVFNEDFEKLGTIFTNDDIYSDDSAVWETDREELKPYLEEIVSKIEEKLQFSQSENIDPNNPIDMEFFAQQFEISEEQLKKAIESVGTSIFSITQYLQK